MSFLVRRLSQHTPPQPPNNKKSQQKFIIHPDKIIFDANQQLLKQNVIKLTITNLHSNKIQFQIKQPKQQRFLIKCTKTQLQPGQPLEFYLFNNFQHFTKNINDQIVISSNIAHIAIPIEVINCQQGRKAGRSLRKSSKTKQNILNSKINNTLNTTPTIRRDIKRKQGLMILNRDRDRYQGTIMTRKQQSMDISLHSRILKFTQQYQRISIYLKDKAIKNQIYLGQKPITTQKTNQIISFNLSTQLLTRQLIEQTIIKRYQNIKSQNGPSVRLLDNIRLQWNKNRNLSYITYQKGLNKVMKVVRNVVVHRRFRKMNKILSIYRSMRDNQGVGQPLTKIINRHQFSSENESTINQHQQSILDNDDIQYITYHQQIKQKKQHNYYCQKITKILANKKQPTFGTDFTKFTLLPKFLPVGYVQPKKKKSHKFIVKPRIGFDIWVFLEEINMYSHQLNGYTKMDRLPEWECHPCYSDTLASTPKTTKNSLPKPHQQHNTKYQNQQLQQFSTPKIDKIEQLTNIQSTKSRQRQFEQSVLKQLCNMYKNYQLPESELSCFDLDGIGSMETDIYKPNKTSIQNINQIKHNRQQYLPYWQTPSPSFINSFFQPQPQQLMYQINKQQILDFDAPSPLTTRILDYIQQSQYNHRNAQMKISRFSSHKSNGSLSECLISQHQLSFKKQVNGFAKQWGNTQNKNKGEQTDTILHEQIIQYMKLSLIRKYGVAHGKIGSFNYFVKEKDNKIYY